MVLTKRSWIAKNDVDQLNWQLFLSGFSTMVLTKRSWIAEDDADQLSWLVSTLIVRYIVLSSKNDVEQLSWQQFSP